MFGVTSRAFVPQPEFLGAFHIVQLAPKFMNSCGVGHGRIAVKGCPDFHTAKGRELFVKTIVIAWLLGEDTNRHTIHGATIGWSWCVPM